MSAGCNVSHAPGRSYVCWTHHRFLPWSLPFAVGADCCCDRAATPEQETPRPPDTKP